jgi:flavin reductase (DIM6/NTAB) family NADH-FMN oxidoreductase RutF
MSELLGPTQAIMITSRAEIDYFGKKTFKDDVDTIYWHMPISSDARKFAIAVPNNKSVLNLIALSKVFILNFLPVEMQDVAEKCDKMISSNHDKISKLGLLTLEGDGVECLRLKGASAYIECNVEETKKFQDCTFITANIIKTDFKYRTKRLFRIEEGNYTTTKDY